jgi:hypothetical protein
MSVETVGPVGGTRVLKRHRFGKNWRNATSHERGLFVVIIINLSLYAYVLLEFPSFISDIVIYSIGSTLLTVEGFFLAFTSQISQPDRKVAVGVGVVAVLFSVLTISKAYFESIQLKYLSYAPTTAIFESDIVMFGLFVGVYAVSIVWPETRTRAISEKDERLLY